MVLSVWCYSKFAVNVSINQQHTCFTLLRPDIMRHLTWLGDWFIFKTATGCPSLRYYSRVDYGYTCCWLVFLHFCYSVFFTQPLFCRSATNSRTGANGGTFTLLHFCYLFMCLCVVEIPCC
ncbi:hypothetical protein F4803DRAFT_488427 [Xylaria telfairii]|nr:hypothetical protein F4803DRAFT_488427 [Xylaria telfairii]